MRIIGVIVLVATMNGCGAKKKEAPADAQRVDAEKVVRVEATVEVPVDVGLGELYSDYRANEIGADAKYRGKVLRVTGIVGRVGKDLNNKPFVALHLGGNPDGLRVSFSTDAGLAELKPWQVVAMRCYGGSSLGLPTLSDCVFESVIEK